MFEACLINVVSQSYVGGPCVNRRKGNAGEDVGERGILFTAGGNVDFHNGNQCGGPLNINSYHIIQLCILGYISLFIYY